MSRGQRPGYKCGYPVKVCDNCDHAVAPSQGSDLDVPDLWIDFNDVDPFLRVTATAQPGEPVSVGDVLVVGDHEGNLIGARVEGVERGLVYLFLMSETFKSGTGA